MYSPPDMYEKGKPAAVETSKTIVKQLSTFLADKKFFAGAYCQLYPWIYKGQNISERF